MPSYVSPSYVSDALSDSGHISDDRDTPFDGAQLPQPTWSSVALDKSSVALVKSSVALVPA